MVTLIERVVRTAVFFPIFRVEYIVKKGTFGGDKRRVHFVSGDGDKMEIKTSGIMTPEATFSIGPGLPNTTSK